MAANSRLASATQILCVMAYIGEATTSQVIANSLATNPVVVLKILKLLQHAGLAELRPGKDGGVALARSPDEITLGQVHAAVDAGETVFALRERGNPKCPVNRTMPTLLEPVFASASQAVAAVLERTTIGSLTQTIPAREDP